MTGLERPAPNSPEYIDEERTSPMAMEVLRGTATAVRYTIDVRGGDNNSGVSTSHHTIFKIGGTTVIFISGSPAVIGEGDRLVVAGSMKGKLLIAQAYVKHTAQVKGNAGVWSYFVAMIFCFLLGTAGLIIGVLGTFTPGVPIFERDLRLIAVAIGVVFCCFGLYCLYQWQYIRDAVKLVEHS
jgi:hypothetical protein